jgi:hypothetical protein
MSRFRVGRWIALSAALPVLWACNARQLAAPESRPQRVSNSTFPVTLNRDLDIVFMIDDSQSMQPLINKLTRNFQAFMQVFEALPEGLPNIHIAVVSSSLGAGASTGVPGCPTGGDGGRFQDQVGRGTVEGGGIACTKTGLSSGQHFISNVAGVANYDETLQVSPLIPPGIATVFSCIASLGDQGCGFEHQLASVARALSKDDVTSADGMPVPATNVGFLRPGAFLGIVLITNEDDCSAPPDSGMFDTSSRFVSDPLGPLWSYRCNEFGHLCNGAPPPSRTVAYSFGPGACVPAEEKGQLIPVHTLVDQIKSLKNDPSLIYVAAIAGPPSPYSMTPIPTMNHDPAGVMPNIDHSCVTQGTVPEENGDPSIRLQAFVDGFGDHGRFDSICADTFAPALKKIAAALSVPLGPKCMVGQLLDKEGHPTTDDANGVAIAPDCAVVQHQPAADGLHDVPLPRCSDNPGGGRCWEMKVDTQNCPTGSHLLDFQPPPNPTESSSNASVSCSISAS